MELKVKFTKLDNDKIKYQLPCKMFCDRMNEEIPNNMTLDKTDSVIKIWLGDSDKAFKNKNVIYKVVNIRQVYDPCDKPLIK